MSGSINIAFPEAETVEKAQNILQSQNAEKKLHMEVTKLKENLEMLSPRARRKAIQENKAAKFKINQALEERKPELLGQNEKSWTKQFFETTHLHGFSFIQNSVSWWEMGMWYILIVVFLLKMSLDLAALISQYNNQHAVTEVTMKFNTSLKGLFGCILNNQ